MAQNLSGSAQREKFLLELITSKYIPGEVPRFTTFMEALMGYCYAMRKKKVSGCKSCTKQTYTAFSTMVNFLSNIPIFFKFL